MSTPNLEIPEFLKDSFEDNTDKIAAQIIEATEKAVEENAISEDRNHYKELARQADAYSEKEVRVIAKRFATNYPEILVEALFEYLDDIQKLAGSITSQSRDFITKREEV